MRICNKSVYANIFRYVRTSSEQFRYRKKNKNCPKCGKKMISGKRNAPISILSLFGHLPLERDTIFCRRCGKGHGIIDETIGINQEHRMTKGMIEMATYVAQCKRQVLFHK